MSSTAAGIQQHDEYVLFRTSIQSSPENNRAHNPILHPLRWLKDPYYLEKLHYHDRPYPVSSPAFSNVPLIGPLLAATIGKLVKPPVRMHEEEWDGRQYSLYSTRLEPKGPEALPPPKPGDEFTLAKAMKKEAGIFSEYTGLFGFVARSLWNAVFPDYKRWSLHPAGHKNPRAHAPARQPPSCAPSPAAPSPSCPRVLALRSAESAGSAVSFASRTPATLPTDLRCSTTAQSAGQTLVYGARFRCRAVLHGVSGRHFPLASGPQTVPIFPRHPRRKNSPFHSPRVVQSICTPEQGNIMFPNES